MSLLTQRPRHWNNVIGQDRALKVLRALLKSERFMLRGIIFEGVRGVGKTSVAYLTARALMCKGKDPEGCGECASCRLIDSQGIDSHPDFIEVAGPRTAGVEASREILNNAESLPVLGKRRIVMIDEAHALTPDAWKVYLKPLEKPVNDTIYEYVSNKGNLIPEEIRGRCVRPKFGKVPEDTILGFLVNVANGNQIQYELDALRAISRASKGIVREALGWLDICAAVGTVTKELAMNIMDDDLEDTSIKIFTAMIAKDQAGAVKLADDACKTEAPVRLVESMFSTFAKCVYRAETPEQVAIRDSFRDTCSMTQVFLKWVTPSQLSADVVPLLVVELMSLGEGRAARAASAWSGSGGSVRVAPPPGVEGPSKFAELTGAKETR